MSLYSKYLFIFDENLVAICPDSYLFYNLIFLQTVKLIFRLFKKLARKEPRFV